MRRRVAILLCLVLSGLTALVYQIVWTRLLGLSFGATTEAIATVLAVFLIGIREKPNAINRYACKT